MATEPQNEHIDRWFPTQHQLRDPVWVERSFRQALTQQYQLEDRVRELTARIEKMSPATSSGTSQNGPADTKLLGLHVVPVDTRTLADGAMLKFSKANGNFYFG